MAEYGALIEREMRRMHPHPFGMDELVRRRERKQRRQRVATIVVAVLLAVVIGVALRSLRLGERQLPARPEPITPENVARMRLDWSGAAPGAYAPAVSGDRVVVAGGSSLFAFPERCRAPGGTCPPAWTAHLDEPVAAPAAANGIVYAVGLTKHPGLLSAFDAACGTGGASCRPLWTADVGGVKNTELSPVVSEGIVYVLGREGAFAFPASCGSAGAVCAPLWRADARHAGSIAVGGHLVFVGSREERGSLSVFPVDCGASPCRPLWTRRFEGAVFGIALDGDRLYVGTNAGFLGTGPGLSVFSLADCSSSGGACRPQWTAAMTGDVVRVVPTGSAVIVQDFSGLYAFPVDCRSDGGRCEPLWTFTASRSPLGTAPPVVVDGLVFAGDRDGGAIAVPVDCSGPCSEAWSGRTPGSGFVGIAADRGIVFANSDAGLTAFALPGSEPGTAPASSTGGGPTVIYVVLLLGLAVALLVRRRSV